MAERLPRPAQPLPLTVVRTGQHLVRQGDAHAGAWLVEAGALLASAVGEDGRTIGIDVLGPDDVVGDLEGRPSSVGVRALRPCRLRPVPPHLVADLASERHRRLVRLALELAWLPVEDRIDRRLTDLAERFGRPVADGTLVALPLSQEDLAALAGTSRETANRALSRLARRGRVRTIGRGRYLVFPSLRPVAGP